MANETNTVLMFADVMALMADTEKDLQHKLTGIEEELALKNMKINVEKTKTEKNNI